MLAKTLARFTRAAEFIAATVLAAIFVIFILQVLTRYTPRLASLMPVPVVADWMAAIEPIGWTINLISLLWVWLIFFGCATFVRDDDHVAFDVLYQSAGRQWRRIMAISTAILMVAVMAYSFGPTWDTFFVSRLMDLKKIQTLSVPFTGEKIAVKWLFAAYLLLMARVFLRHLWRLYNLTRYGLAESVQPVGERHGRQRAGGVK